MAVFGAPSASKDAMVVSRRQDNGNVIRWRRRDVNTSVVTPVDLSGWPKGCRMIARPASTVPAWPGSSSRDLEWWRTVGSFPF